MSKFKEGNNVGKGRPKGSTNKVNKEALINLVNQCVTDLNDNYQSLNSYQKIKLITAFKDIYRDTITEQDNSLKLPEVIFIKTIPNL